MTSDASKSLHQEVVEGIVRIIRYLHKRQEEGGGRFTTSDLITAASGQGFRNEESSMFVFEYIKDGIISMRPEDSHKVISGDYSDIWRMTNGYLKRFGHPPIDPCEVNP